VPTTRPGPAPRSKPVPWDTVRERLRARGQRWTPQRRALVEVLAGSHGHVTGSELVERCRAIDPATVPSTVYRTLGVLEELGLVRHSHGHDGREEFHVLPEADHGHLHCTRCGRTWELPLGEIAGLLEGLRERRGFEVDVSHLSIGGLCSDCERAPGGRAKGHAHPSTGTGAGAAAARPGNVPVSPPRRARRGR
jgi:Fur family ferric uptake transcriptional regulator